MEWEDTPELNKQGPLADTWVLFFQVCVCVIVAQSCPTLCDPMDCSLPGSSVHGIFEATVLEWGTIADPVDMEL